ncbi:MAG: hypothetical protein FJ050_11600, partial [Cyanobacteria bacterium M_surface_7_m2_040]|nr:hypothetical protein [Cyanobacteria bacterium M_surface_7_m2_040]
MSSTSWGPHPLALLLALGLLGAVLHPSSAGKAQAQRANARVPGLVAQAAPESDAPLELVLDRRRKQLRVIEAGRERRRYPVAI